MGRGPRLVPLLIGAGLLVIAVPDIVFSDRAVAGASYALVAVVASALLSVRWTAVVAAAAVVLAAVSGGWNQNLF